MTEPTRNDAHPGLTVNEWRRAKLLLRMMDHAIAQMEGFHSTVLDVAKDANHLANRLRHTIDRMNASADDLLAAASCHGLDPLEKIDPDDPTAVGPDGKPFDV